MTQGLPSTSTGQHWSSLLWPRLYHTGLLSRRRACYPSEQPQATRSLPRGPPPGRLCPSQPAVPLAPELCVHECCPFSASAGLWGPGCATASLGPLGGNSGPHSGGGHGQCWAATVPHSPGWARFSSLGTQHPTSPPGSTSTGTRTHLMSLICHTSFRENSALGLCPGIQTDTEEWCGGSAELNKRGMCPGCCWSLVWLRESYFLWNSVFSSTKWEYYLPILQACCKRWCHVCEVSSTMPGTQQCSKNDCYPCHLLRP